MREQAEVDKATIESLRTHQGGLENQVAEQDSWTISGGAGLRSLAPDTDEWNLLRSSSCAEASWHVMSSAGEASHEADYLEAMGEEWPLTQEECDMIEDDMDTTKEPLPQWIERHCGGVLKGNSEGARKISGIAPRSESDNQKYRTPCKTHPGRCNRQKGRDRQRERERERERGTERERERE